MLGELAEKGNNLVTKLTGLQTETTQQLDAATDKLTSALGTSSHTILESINDRGTNLVAELAKTGAAARPCHDD